jgi:membrane protein DedA with SNARE-associated domain
MPTDLLLFWALPLAALFLGTLIHEDVAILSGAYLAAHDGMPAMLVLPTLFFGVVAGDFAIYGMGALARRTAGHGRWRWLRRRLDGEVVARAEAWLRHNLFVVVASCRVLPLALFPTYGACGWLRIPFRRFSIPVIVSAALYVPALFTLFRVFGEELARELDSWGWFSAAGVLALGLLVRRRFAPQRLMDRLAARGRPGPAQEAVLASHRGMPPLRRSQIRVPLSERINEQLFYVPLVAQWLYLGARHRSLTLPTVANPLIEAGGLLGESKYAYFTQAGAEARRWLARTAIVEPSSVSGACSLDAAEAAMVAVGITYPAVAKPDIAWRGYGCRRVEDRAALADYLAAFPRGARLLLQEYVAHEGEAGVFYVRRPGEARGAITSLTFRYYPFVVGDGRSTLGELIRSDPRLARKARMHCAAHRARLGDIPARGETVRLALVGSNRVGGLYVDAARHITPAFAARFDAIAAALPEFHFGRFDVRFGGVEQFEAGRDFVIIEINGAGAEAIQVWDPEYRLGEVYRVLFRQQSLLFEVAAANRARGYRPMRAHELVRLQRRQYRLNSAYPQSG